MQILDLLDDAPGGAAAKNLAATFGIDPAKTAAAVAVMGAALADRIERHTLSRGGVADITDLLARPALGRALQEPQNLASPEIAAVGNGILEVLSGSKHWSRGIALAAARESGADQATLERMLPVVASMLIGALQKKAMPHLERIAANASQLTAMLPAHGPLPLPGERPMAPESAPDEGSPGGQWNINLPNASGGSGRSGTSGGTGSGPSSGGSPLPIPGDRIPGVNDNDAPSRFPRLPDIVRRGGRQIPIPDDADGDDGGGPVSIPGGGSGGGPVVIPGRGSLDQIIRQILANVLGFKNGGILSWIVNLLLSRWVLGLVGRIIRRVLLGR